MHSGYGKCNWNVYNDYARNAISFGNDKSSSSNSDNYKNNFIVLGEGDTFSINGRFCAPEKNFGVNSSKANKKICLCLHYLFLDGKELKASNKNSKS